MAVGQGMVAQAIQRNTESSNQAVGLMIQGMGLREQKRSSLVREALAGDAQTEQERSNKVREGMAAEGLADARRRTEIAGASQKSTEAYQAGTLELQDQEMQLKKDEMWLAQKPQWDKIAEGFYAGVADFNDQQAELMTERKELQKNLGKTGLGTEQMASTAAMLKSEIELEQLETKRRAFIDGYQNNPAMLRALSFSTPGLEDATLGDVSPYALSKMSPEEAEASKNSSMDNNNKYQKVRRQIEQQEADIQARMLENAARAESKGKAEGAYETESKLLAEEMGFKSEIAQEEAIAKGTKAAYEDKVEGYFKGLNDTLSTAQVNLNNLLIKRGKGAEYKLLGAGGADFKGGAEKYYGPRPQQFEWDTTLVGGLMTKIAENHKNPNWMRKQLQNEIKILVEGKNDAAGNQIYPGLSRESDTPQSNPFYPILNSFNVLQKNASAWGQDASKAIGQIALTWKATEEEAIQKKAKDLGLSDYVPSINQ